MRWLLKIAHIYTNIQPFIYVYIYTYIYLYADTRTLSTATSIANIFALKISNKLCSSCQYLSLI